MENRALWTLFFAVGIELDATRKNRELAMRLKRFMGVTVRDLPRTFLLFGDFFSTRLEKTKFVEDASEVWEGEGRVLMPMVRDPGLLSQVPRTPRSFTETVAKYPK